MFKRAVSYYKPYKLLFAIDLLCAVAVAVIELIFPSVVSYIVDDLLPLGKWKEMITVCIVLLLAYMLNTGLYIVIDYWGEQLGMFIENDMRNDLFEHLQKLSYKFFDNNKTGQLISKVSNDLHQIGTVAHYAPEQFIVASSMLITTVSVMASINGKLSLLVLGVVAILLMININFTKKMVNTSRALFISAGNIAAELEESFAGIRVVQAYANEEFQRKSLKEKTLEYCKNQKEGYRQVAICNGITYYLTKFLPILIILFGGWLALENQITKGQFFSYILLANMVLKPVEMISNFVARYPKGIAGFISFLEIMDMEPDVVDHQKAIEVNSLKGNISIKHVNFSYDNRKIILKDLSLEIAVGETVAIVGSSGAGKSTLCNLLPRFYDIQSGSIIIDGMNIKNVKLQSLRRQIGVVAQDVFLFSGTIEENIRFGKLDATEEEIWEAAKKAQLDTFIINQSKGMKTMIGERGVKLSGGQKQRLSIARMFLKNPPILILDEATSALDAENELAIHNSLKQLAKGRTTLIIAHRFSTIKDADRIVVVENSEIIQEGNHDELICLEGTYKRLYSLQQNIINE